MVRVPTLFSARAPSSASSLALTATSLEAIALERRLIVGEGRPGVRDDQPLGGDALLERLAFERLRLADPRGGKAALVERDAALQADAGGGARPVEAAGVAGSWY